MELINTTRMVAGYTVGLEPNGRELLIVAVKGTFNLPRPGQTVQLAEKQIPLLLADSFTGEPGLSAPQHEVDYAPRKRACDVLLLGSAYAPEGRQVTRMQVALQVGPMRKAFDAIGNRVWRAGLTGISSSPPQPFARMPISYDVAFGGTDCNSQDERDHDAYLDNPVGRGWHKHLKDAWVDGTPLPNTEEQGSAVAKPNGKYKPMALSPIGRAWPRRRRYAGTYDQHWLDEVFPWLPTDFDERYYQASPEDQQIRIPSAPMEITLHGFTPEGTRRFVLPHFEAPLHVFPKQGRREHYTGLLDTIVFEPDDERFTITWRVTRPLKKSLHEIAQVVVGRGAVMAGHPIKVEPSNTQVDASLVVNAA